MRLVWCASWRATCPLPRREDARRERRDFCRLERCTLGSRCSCSSPPRQRPWMSLGSRRTPRHAKRPSSLTSPLPGLRAVSSGCCTRRPSAPKPRRIARRWVRLLEDAEAHFVACYERELYGGAAPFEGSVELSLSIDASGGSVSVRVASDSTGHPTTAACAGAVIHTFRFGPPPRGEARYKIALAFSHAERVEDETTQSVPPLLFRREARPQLRRERAQ